MRIILARNWFSPSGERFRKEANPHTVSDEWKTILPTGTKILDEPVVEAPAVETKKAQKELPL